MFCPDCGTEYREGFTVCSDCDVALVASIEEPEAQQPSALIPLTEERSFEIVAELLDRLEKAAVPYVIEAGTALALLDDAVEELSEPQPWEARIYVASALHQRATEILIEVRGDANAERALQVGERYLHDRSRETL